MKLAHQSRFDFDHPDAIDMELFASVRAPFISHAPRIRDVLELGVFRHSAYQTSSHVVKRTFLSIPSPSTNDWTRPSIYTVLRLSSVRTT